MQDDLFASPTLNQQANKAKPFVESESIHFNKLLHRADLPDISLRYYPTAFSHEQHLLKRLIKDIPWQQDSIQLYGKSQPIPRLQAWLSNNPSPYSYSGFTLAIHPIPSWLSAVQTKVEVLSQSRFNAVLANLYRNGQDSVAAHADDEAELGPAPVIASLSFGASRDFILKPKASSPFAKAGLKPLRLNLASGSLLVMNAGLQSHFLHAIPKQPAVLEPRVNLTFRFIHG